MTEKLEPPKPATYDEFRATGRLRWLRSAADSATNPVKKAALLQAEWEIIKVTLTGQRLSSAFEWRDVPTVEAP